MIAKKITVTGTVQGVFFRASAQQEAARLQLTGWVKNVGSDTVEAFACGSPESVEKFVDWCRRGPSGARVQQLRAEDAEPASDSSFRIIR